MKGKKNIMSETKEVGWFERCVQRVIAFWNSGWIGIVGSFFVGSCELVLCHWISGIGWIFAGIWMWGYIGEKGFYDELYELYHKHLDLCEKRDTMLEVALEKLRKYEPEDESNAETKSNMDNIERKQ